MPFSTSLNDLTHIPSSHKYLESGGIEPVQHKTTYALTCACTHTLAHTHTHNQKISLLVWPFLYLLTWSTKHTYIDWLEYTMLHYVVKISFFNVWNNYDTKSRQLMQKECTLLTGTFVCMLQRVHALNITEAHTNVCSNMQAIPPPPPNVHITVLPRGKV